ncbi:MAG: glutamyl-tRNA reductase [Verrucomicrobia bacterium]|nr:MAG: glutamyl-tRNA reductase [Verrucomicrobiota bacterium]
MSFLVIGLSHRSAPVGVRERMAVVGSRVPESLAALRGAGLATEAVLVSTCNRVEWYLAAAGDPAAVAARLWDFLGIESDLRRILSDRAHALAGDDALGHLFRVASGLDSLVRGETEILGQLKAAYETARAGGHTGRILNRAFQRAFAVAKEVRTRTGIQRGNTSVASVAVELAERVLGGLVGREVLVVGAGDTGGKTARALLGRGVRGVTVANRSPDRAVALAAALGGRAIPFDGWELEVPRVDMVVSCTDAPHRILDRPRLERLLAHREPRPLLLVDLAVPRDIDPEAGRLRGVFLHDIDGLQAVADAHADRRRGEARRVRFKPHLKICPGQPGIRAKP